MSNILPARPRQMASRRTFAVVASQYNPAYVQGLIENFKRELDVISPNASTPVYEVPGAFEIPIAVQEVLAHRQIDVVIAFGVILEGETRHAEFIGRAVSDALQQIALKFSVPVIHEVLVVRDEQQARERCLDAEFNRGVEAARSALQIIRVLGDIRHR